MCLPASEWQTHLSTLAMNARHRPVMSKHVRTFESGERVDEETNPRVLFLLVPAGGASPPSSEDRSWPLALEGMSGDAG